MNIASRRAPDLGAVTESYVPVWRQVFGMRNLGSVQLLTAYLVLLMLIPSSLIFSPLGGDGTPAEIFSFVIIIWYVAWWITGRIVPSEGSAPIRAATFLFLIATLASFVAGMTRDITSTEALGADRILLTTAAWFGVVVVISRTITSYRDIDVIMRRAVIMGSVVAAIGIFEFYSGVDITNYFQLPGLTINAQAGLTDLITRGSLNRPSSTAIDPIELGVVMAMLLPFALQQAMTSVGGSRLRKWCPVVLIGAAIPMSVSRSGMLGVAVCILLLAPTWTGRQSMGFLIASILGVGALNFAAPRLVSTLVNYSSAIFTGSGDGNSVGARLSALSLDYQYILQRPILGRGAGTFLSQLYNFTDDVYLHSLIEMGIVGLISLVGIFLAGIHCAAAGRRRTEDGARRAFGQALVASVSVAAVTSATFDSLGFPMFAGVLFLILGISGAYYQVMVKENRSVPFLGNPHESKANVKRTYGPGGR